MRTLATSSLDDSAFMNLDGNVTLNQSTTSSQEGKENEEDQETASNDSDSKDDSKDDSRAEISSSAPSPEQEKDVKDTDTSDSKVVDEPNTPSSALDTVLMRRWRRDHQKFIEKKMAEYEKLFTTH